MSARLANFLDESTGFTGPVRRPADFYLRALPDARARAIAALFILGLLLALTWSSLHIVVAGLEVPAIYHKDFDQEWLMARAVLDRQNPYHPEYLLAQRYEPLLEPYVQQHAAPHPPLVAVLVAPLGLLPFDTAAKVWLAIELTLLPIGIVAILKSASGSRVRLHWVLLSLVALLGWSPITHELFVGQLTLVLLALLSWAGLTYVRGRLRLAGVLLGLAISIKLFPVVLAAYFVARGSWSVIRWAGATVLISTALSCGILGVDALRSFVTLGLTGAAGWRSAEGNYSIFGAAAHIVEGSRATPPLVPAPSLVMPLAGLGLVILFAVAWKAWRASSADVGLALASVLMVIASPVAWQHYLPLLAYPMMVTARRLQTLSWLPGPRRLAILVVALLSVPVGSFMSVVIAIFGVRDASSTLVGLSPGANVLLLLLPAGPLLLFCVLLDLAAHTGVWQPLCATSPTAGIDVKDRTQRQLVLAVQLDEARRGDSGKADW